MINMLDYEYVFRRFKRKSHISLIDKTLNCMMNFYDNSKVNILCSWFCERDIFFLKKMGYKLEDCFFYDYDEIVHNENIKITNNCFLNDIIFDKLLIDGLKIHRYCEYTYPIGKIYHGDFILCGNDEKSLHICNPIESIQQLIDQNELNEVYYSDSWNVRREYDSKKLTYYMVAGKK